MERPNQNDRTGETKQQKRRYAHPARDETDNMHVGNSELDREWNVSNIGLWNLVQSEPSIRLFAEIGVSFGIVGTEPNTPPYENLWVTHT